MNYVARALEVDETRGFMKAIVDAETGQILGAAVLGLEGGEIMSHAGDRHDGQAPLHRLKEAIFAHPTLAESLNNLFATLDDMMDLSQMCWAIISVEESRMTRAEETGHGHSTH